MENIVSNILSAVAPFLTTAIIVLVVFGVLYFVATQMYKKAPPNVAMVVTGPRGSKTIVGKGCFIIPILH